jgi:hypothetical protein
MVLKISVTKDIDAFYNNTDSNFTYYISRGTLVFYDLDDITALKIIDVNDNTYNINEDNIICKSHKYTVSFPKNIKCGRYTLLFNKNRETHKLILYIFPKQFNTYCSKFKHQDLNLINDDFYNLLCKYNKSVNNDMLIKKSKYNSYLKGMVQWFYNNNKINNVLIDLDKIKQILSCIGFLFYKDNNNDDIILFKNYKDNDDIILKIATMGRFNHNVHIHHTANYLDSSDIILDITSFNNNNPSLLYEAKNVKKSKCISSFHFFNNYENIYYNINLTDSESSDSENE